MKPARNGNATQRRHGGKKERQNDARPQQIAVKSAITPKQEIAQQKNPVCSRHLTRGTSKRSHQKSSCNKSIWYQVKMRSSRIKPGRRPHHEHHSTQTKRPRAGQRSQSTPTKPTCQGPAQGHSASNGHTSTKLTCHGPHKVTKQQRRTQHETNMPRATRGHRASKRHKPH